MRRLLFFLFVLLSSGGGAAAQVHVEVRELPRSDSWRVTIRHPRRVDGVVFDATRTPFRAGRWRIVEPSGARWQRVAGKDAILFRKGRRDVVLEFASDYRKPEKDYQLNVGFSDGSRLIYTGHLRTRPLIGVNILDPKREVPHRWTFRTDALRDVRAIDKRGVGTLAIEPTTHDTYVYFGRVQPVVTNRRVILDPALPKWILDDMERFIPQQFAFFERTLKMPLDFSPLVILSWGGAQSSGYTFAGGTLPNLVQMELIGEGWTRPGAETSRMWFRHLAHEIFHLWGGQLYTPSPDAEWLSEGSAEYFALLAMRDAGMLDERQFHHTILDASSDCIAGLGNHSILASAELGRFRNFYTCGMVVQFLADDALRRTSNGERSLATLFHDLFIASRRKERRYSTADFEALLASQTTDANAITAIHHLIHEGAPPDLTERLRVAGVRE